MQIRAITVGQRQRIPVDRDAVQRAGAFAQRAKGAFQQAGHQVQVLRLATQPLSQWLGRRDARQAVGLSRALEDAVAAAGIDYCSVGPVLASGADGPLPLIDALPALLGETQRVFATVMAATSRDGINLAAVHQAAAALVQIGALDKQGAFARRFAVTANVPPFGPFFPSAYHRGAADSFSIAIQAADLAVDAFTGAETLAHAQQRLLQRVEQEGRALVEVARGLERSHGLRFRGLDISLAPFPEAGSGIAEAMERLGVAAFGAHGTLFAGALVTNVLRRARLPKCGFSGLMLPLLEDATMAARHTQGLFGIDSLLLYSAVCGTGLDTIPIPGNATAGQIASVYLDLCALAVTLRKPLTARLMPMPGKAAGDRVRFDFPFFAPTTVAAIGAEASAGLFGRGSWRPMAGGAE